MLRSKTPSCSILSRVKNKCLTLDSLTRKMYPGLARLLTSGRLHFHLHCLSAEKVAFPSDCFCAFLISSEAGSCHSELPSLMGYIFFPEYPLLLLQDSKPSRIYSGISEAFFSGLLSCMSPFIASKRVHSHSCAFLNTCRARYCNCLF